MKYSRAHDCRNEIFNLGTNYPLGRKKTLLRILDVGSLNSEVAVYLKKNPAESGPEVIVSSVDPAPWVFKDPRRDLDKFYDGNIEDAIIDGKHDVVLCIGLLPFAAPCRQKALIGECATHRLSNSIFTVDAIPVTSADICRVIENDWADQYGDLLICAWNGLPWWSYPMHTMSLHVGMIFVTSICKAVRAVCNMDREESKA